MRVALIATGERGADPAPSVAGRALVLRQFDFARACGVERVIGYGNGAPEEALALAEAAVRARIAHSAIASSHALVALVEWADELIVLEPGLLPEAPVAIEALRRGPRVLSFSAGAVRGSGFERIDAANFWSGALIMPGGLVDRLEQLGEDADPHAALLRIALQARLPLDQLPPSVLADGRWGLAHGDERAAALCARRVRAIARSGPLAPPSRRLVDHAFVRLAPRLSERPYAPAASLLLAGLLLCAGLLAAWSGWTATAFTAIAAAPPLLQLGRLLDRVRRAAFQPQPLPRWLGWLPDGALLAAGIMALEGPWYGRLFPPLVLIVAVRAITRGGWWRALAADRVAGALAIGAAALAGAEEPALMAWALLALTAAIASPSNAGQRSSTGV